MRPVRHERSMEVLNPGFRQIGSKMAHAVINHSLAYFEPVCVRLASTGGQLTYTNTIDGFWRISSGNRMTTRARL